MEKENGTRKKTLKDNERLWDDTKLFVKQFKRVDNVTNCKLT